MNYASLRQKDYYEMEISEYIGKYYSNYDRSLWDKYWKDGILGKLLDKERQNELRIDWGIEGKGKYFDFNRMQKFYDDIKDDYRFDDDIKRFFAFLALDGYFEFHKISYEEFLNARNLNYPHDKLNDSKLPTLNELSKMKGGQNYIRAQLLSLGWLKM